MTQLILWYDYDMIYVILYYYIFNKKSFFFFDQKKKKRRSLRFGRVCANVGRPGYGPWVEIGRVQVLFLNTITTERRRWWFFFVTEAEILFSVLHLHLTKKKPKNRNPLYHSISMQAFGFASVSASCISLSLSPSLFGIISLWCWTRKVRCEKKNAATLLLLLLWMNEWEIKKGIIFI